MKTERSTKISALYDGELEEQEVRAAIRLSLDDTDSWRIYGLIGDGLRGESVDVRDLTASVMSRLGEEPVVLAPRKLKVAPRHHPLWALAASVAGVAVVGWVALTGTPQSSSPALPLAAIEKEKLMTRANAVPPAPTLAQAQPAGSVPGDLHEYLLAHHAQGASSRLGDSTRQIRTVSMNPARP